MGCYGLLQGIFLAQGSNRSRLSLLPWLADSSPPRHPGSSVMRLNELLCSVVLSRLSHARPSATPGTAAHQAPLSLAFSRPEHCSGLLFPPPGAPPDPGTDLLSPVAPALQADSSPLSRQGSLNELICM